MAFGQLGMQKIIALNAPKYKRIVEPFGDNGTLALYPGKKKPKEHIVNFEDETLFALMSFIQGVTAADKKRLKAFDWVASSETFEAALSITAVEGAELFYRFFYLKHFGVRSKDPETPPTFDWLKVGKDASQLLFTLPQMKGAFKKATLINEEPLSVMSSGGGSDTFLILIPKKPEHVEAVEARLNGLSENFFFAKKSMSNDDLFAAVEGYADYNVSAATDATIMVATMEVMTNYDSRLQAIDLEELGYVANS